jgi:hypothetical protein
MLRAVVSSAFMTKRDRIIALAVTADKLRQQLGEVEAELDQLISSRKRPKRKREKAVVGLTSEQRAMLATGPLAQRVTKLLELNLDRPLSVAQIVEMIQADKPQSVRGILSRLKTSGTVMNVGRGAYALRQPGRPRTEEQKE